MSDGGRRALPPLPPAPPASQPHMRQRGTPDHLTYIPRQERSFGYCQPDTRPQHLTPNTSPMTGNNSGPHSFPPHPAAPPSLPSNPPLFSTPPPTLPPRFSQPPPAIPRTPGTHNPAALWNPLTASLESSLMWQLLNPPDPRCPQLQGDRGLGTVTHPVTHPATQPVTKKAADRGAMEQKEEMDLKWLEEFEKKLKSCPPPPPPPPSTGSTTTTKKIIKLAEVQKMVLDSYTLKEQLCGLEEELRQVSDSAEEEEWDRLVQQAEDIKTSLNGILESFRDQEFVECTKMLLKQRRAKRSRVKRRRKERQLEKEEVKRRREEEEAEIDAWRAKLKREEDSRRQEEAVKREADGVLSEVRQKQSEGRRMLQLLKALADLRRTRAVQAHAQGQPRDEEADKRFANTTEMISKMVKEQLQEYELEEQTLRVMMEESASHRSAAQSAKRDAKFAQYEDSIRTLLFGPTASADSEEAAHTLESLVHRRQEWDQYLAEGSNPLASAVPLSWVLPPTQPDEAWAAFLKW